MSYSRRSHTEKQRRGYAKNGAQHAGHFQAGFSVAANVIIDSGRADADSFRQLLLCHAVFFQRELDQLSDGRSVDGSGGVVSYRKILARDITYHVMPKQKFKLHTTGLTGGGTSSTAGGYRDTTTLVITLPPNTLGYSLFPLYLEIESSKNNLNPFISETINDNLSVESGASAFNSQNLFYFLKVVSYDEYMSEGGNVIKLTLKTTKVSGNDCWIAVTDKAGIFNDAFVKLKTGSDATAAASDEKAYDSSWPTD